MTRELRCKKPINCAGCYFQALVKGEYVCTVESTPDLTVEETLETARHAPHGRSARGVIYRRPACTSWGLIKRTSAVEEV